MNTQLQETMQQAAGTSRRTLQRAEGWRRGIAAQCSNRTLACVAAIAVTVGVGLYMAPDAIRYFKIRQM